MATPAYLKRYELFPEHGDPKYHSPHLPLPNVVRIEVMSPEARKRYLGGFHSMTEGFRQGIITQMSGDDCNAPFYGFFDPKTNGDIGFDVNATWSNNEHSGFDSFVSLVSHVPGVGGFVSQGLRGGKQLLSTGLDMMGIDNESTGSNTMKAFRKADFNFTKTIKCSWYMPEMENMARVSISRLLKMAFVKNFDTTKLTGKYLKKLSGLLKDNYDAVKKTYADRKDLINTPAPGETPEDVPPPEPAPENNVSTEQSWLGKAVDSLKSLGEETATFWANQAAPLTDAMIEKMMPLAEGLFDKAINLGLAANEFFGGSLTLNPLPVRLTVGHQLDIEPLVITSLKISGSQEQFMTTDGSNIPLFVNAEIGVTMWMVPDPNKGSVRYLGDNLFNMAYTNASDARNTTHQGDSGDPNTNIMPNTNPPYIPPDVKPSVADQEAAHDAYAQAMEAQSKKAAAAAQNPDAMVFPVFSPGGAVKPMDELEYNYNSPIY